MPIYMDVHILPGVTAKEVAEAHRLDLIHQAEHGCKAMTYWIDEGRGNVFCLVEAPTQDDVEKMHRQAHGLVPNKIMEVSATLVESFLGRIYDPQDATVSDDGLKVFSDPSFRVLLVSTVADSALLRHRLGKEKAEALLNRHNLIVRKKLAIHGGREVEHQGNGFIASFASAGRAVQAALAIRDEIDQSDAKEIGFRTAVNGGEPIEQSDKLFGDTLKLASIMCSIAGDLQVCVSSAVRDLVSKDSLLGGQKNIFALSPQDETLLDLLYSKLEENWQDAEFDMENYCQSVAMSKSQLYRKTISLTGLSPNSLLKEYRLERAKDLMKKQRYSIAQITFDSGFTSASYFTKCFKKKYGLLPMSYIDLLH